MRRRLVDESHRLESDLSLILVAITIVVLSGDVGLEMVPATVEHCLTSPCTLHCTALQRTVQLVPLTTGTGYFLGTLEFLWVFVQLWILEVKLSFRIIAN